MSEKKYLMEKVNHLALICDDNYCMPTVVCIQSLKDCSTNNKYLVHVLSFTLSNSNILLLENMSTKNIVVKVHILDIKYYKTRISQINQKSHVTPAALIKFELPNYFQELDKLLYIDGDIIIKKDISEIFNIDISFSYMAASYELWKYLIKANYSLSQSYNIPFYFNSGVMLFNLKEMRNNNITEKLWEYKLLRAKTKLMDQESFNAICGEKCIHLPIKWNFNPSFANTNFIKHINRIYETQYSCVNEMIDDAILIHYVGAEDKPWIYNNGRMRDFWDIAFKNSKLNITLSLKNSAHQKASRWESIQKKIELYGTWGLLCFVVNKILKRNTL